MNEISNYKQIICNNLRNQFAKDLLTATMLQIEYSDNPIRYNSFAFSFRELSRHIFHDLAPDEEVINCDWYNENEPNKITRAQRIEYAVRGGLSNVFLQNVLKINLQDLKRQIINAINTLNKYTHIEEEAFFVSESLGNSIVIESLKALSDFFIAIEYLRNALIDKLEKTIFNTVEDNFNNELFDEIDILSTHSRIEEVNLDEIKIVEIDSNEITFDIQGTISVELQYGSDRDLKRDNGAVFSDSYPFSILKKVNVRAPVEILIEKNEIRVDTSSFYDDGADDDFYDEDIDD